MYLDDSDAILSQCRFSGNVAEGSDLFGQLASFGGGLATRGPSHLTTIRSGMKQIAKKHRARALVCLEQYRRKTLLSCDRSEVDY